MKLKLPRPSVLPRPSALTRSGGGATGAEPRPGKGPPGRGRGNGSAEERPGVVARHPTMSRLSLVFLVVGLPAAALLYDRVDPPRSPSELPAESAIVTPSVSDPAPLDGAWYCPMGSTSEGGFADHRVHISNLSEDAAVANLVLLTGEGDRSTLRVDLPPMSTHEYPLSSITAAEVAGAVVEIIGGTGVVGHTVDTPSGQAEGPCSTHVSSSWYFASGRTTRDSKQYLALMNPFPEDVRYNVEFYRSAGRPRKPAALTGQEVPANSIRIIEVGEYVAREDAVAAAITTDRGRLVVERLQVLDGELGPSGATLQLGVVAPAQSWMLPAGRVHEGGDDRVIVFNPGSETATVDVELWPLNPTDRSLYGLGAIPRELLPGRFEVIDLRTEADRFGIRLPYELGVSVASTNDVPVVVERWHLATQVDTTLIGAGGDAVVAADPAADPAVDPAADPAVDPAADPAVDPAADPAAAGQLDLPAIFGDETEPLLQPTANVGISTSRGTEVLSSRWVIPWVSIPAENSTVVVVTSPQEAAVEVFVLVNGELQGPLRVSVPPGGRAVVPLPPTGTGAPVLVTASTPISVEAQVVVADSKLATVAGVPTVAS
jgi:hypothetical protein